MVVFWPWAVGLVNRGCFLAVGRRSGESWLFPRQRKYVFVFSKHPDRSETEPYSVHCVPASLSEALK